MPAVTRTWAFDADAENWNSPGSIAFDAFNGDPLAGCIKCGPDADAVAGTPFAGSLWADWGLPANAVITSVDMSVRSRVTAYSAGTTHDVQLTCYLASAFQAYTIIDLTFAGQAADGVWRTSSVVGSTNFNLNSSAVSIGVALHCAPIGEPTVRITAEYDTVVVTIHYTMPTSIRQYGAGPLAAYFPLLFEQEGDDMSCRKALLKAYSRYVTLTNEKAWAYQLIRNYCADWIEVSVGALIDPAASAGAHVLNGNFGVRVWNCALAGDGLWITNTSGAALGNGLVIPFPAWQSPILIPWMGAPVNVLVEFYTADTIAAGTTLELGIAPIQEGA